MSSSMGCPVKLEPFVKLKLHAVFNPNKTPDLNLEISAPFGTLTQHNAIKIERFTLSNSFIHSIRRVLGYSYVHSFFLLIMLNLNYSFEFYPITLLTM